MAKVSFTVSARTARLIGRENIATSKGAIIELVKNGYDADSDISIVFFDNQYSKLFDELSLDQLDDLIAKGISKSDIENVYELVEDNFYIKEEAIERDKASLKKSLNKLNSLYIIDSGEGMTRQIIKNHWMTIGTDHKAMNIFTKSGKVKAGAKGIGRFALDKLGSKCEMITVFDPSNHDPDVDDKGELTDYSGYNWNVNWEDFEGPFKTIGSVSADLTGIKTSSLKAEITRELPELDFDSLNTKEQFNYGTILKITDLRDNWEDFYVEGVYADLEVLVPPKESGGFQIFLISTLEQKNTEKSLAQFVMILIIK